jgi:hypothetical protein
MNLPSPHWSHTWEMIREILREDYGIVETAKPISNVLRYTVPITATDYMHWFFIYEINEATVEVYADYPTLIYANGNQLNRPQKFSIAVPLADPYCFEKVVGYMQSKTVEIRDRVKT